ncbi:MAG: helix-turn-helix domain-containing protein [Bacteroidota bacterium]
MPPAILANALFNKNAVIELVKEVVANFYGVSVEVMHENKRCHKRSKVLPRQVAMYVIKTLAGSAISLSHIGYEFGGKDHATVLYSYKTMVNLMSTDEVLKLQVDQILNIINSRQSDVNFSKNLNSDMYYLNLSNITVLRSSHNSSITFSGISNMMIEKIKEIVFAQAKVSQREFKDTGLFILKKDSEQINDNGNTHKSIQ